MKSKKYKDTNKFIANGKSLHLYTSTELKEKRLLTPADFYILSIKDSIIINIFRGLYLTVFITILRYLLNALPNSKLYLNPRELIIDLIITFIIIQFFFFLLQLLRLFSPKILISLLNIKDDYVGIVLNRFYYLKGFLHKKQKGILYILFFWPFIPYEDIYLLPKELLSSYINKDCSTIKQHYVKNNFFLLTKWYLVLGVLPFFLNFILFIILCVLIFLAISL